MKKYLTLGIIGFLSMIILMNGCSSFNSMVSKNETVANTWADVQAQYQRRLDLIPNLVNTVTAYANFEKTTLTDVINARANATSIKIDPTNMQSIQQYEAAQAQLSGSLSRLMLTVEKYPELKANEQFLSLQAEIAGTENRITVARKDFNSTVQDYNKYVTMFPKNVWAGMFGYSRKDYFEADAGAKNAPQVNFNGIK